MTDKSKAGREILKRDFPGIVITPEATSEYEAHRSVPWSATCWTPAAAYVQPSTAGEVAQVLAIIKQAGSKFAVRSTGHNPNDGFSSADEAGIVLDVRKLQSKELGDDGIARFGAGNTWGEVYNWLEERELSAIGGRDQQVGLSGFLLGGGLGALPNLYGLGTDTVKNFEVVLADGSIVNANADTNAELYRCLKGGGSNFGIVTRFDLETHPLIQVQYTIHLYNPEDHVEIIKTTIALQEAMDLDPKIGMFTNFNNGFIAVGLFYAGWPEQHPEAFARFNNLPSLINTPVPTTNGTLASLAVAMGIAHPDEHMNRRIGTVTTKVSQELYKHAYEISQEASKSLPKGAVLHYTVQPVGPGCVQAGEMRGGNIMGLDNVSQSWWVFTCEWPKDDSDDRAAQKTLDSVVQGMQAAAAEKELYLSFLGMTFATGSQKVLNSYGEANCKTMQKVADKYDSEGIFQKLQHNGFLLRNSL